jgi:hypothetical protein
VQAETDQDVVQLLLVIQGYCCRFDDHQQSTYALEQAHGVSTYYQAHDVANTEYVEHSKSLVSVVETYGGAYGREPGLVATELIAQGVRPEDLTRQTGLLSLKQKKYAANATSRACCSVEPTTADTSSSR